jgi:hypothetical protein
MKIVIATLTFAALPVYDIRSRYVGSDPDPRIRASLARDASNSD